MDGRRKLQAERLKQARVAAGFRSASAAAARFRWAIDTMVKHERGDRSIGRAASKYAEAFRVDEAWLLGLQDAPPDLVPINQKAAVGLQMAIEIVKAARAPASIGPHAATEEALRIAILLDLEKRLKELAS
jgi:hypothetical protein